MYDPSTGRWLIEDPIDFDAGDTNLYRYVYNSPIVFRDPLGTAPPTNPIAGITKEEYKLVTDYLRGKIPIDQVPSRVRQIAADFYGRMSKTVLDRNNARAFNRARALALRTGKNPPGNLATFNSSLKAIATKAVGKKIGALGVAAAGGYVLAAALTEQEEYERKAHGLPPGSAIIDQQNELNGVKQTWRLPDGTTIKKTVPRGGLKPRN